MPSGLRVRLPLGAPIFKIRKKKMKQRIFLLFLLFLSMSVIQSEGEVFWFVSVPQIFKSADQKFYEKNAIEAARKYNSTYGNEMAVIPPSMQKRYGVDAYGQTVPEPEPEPVSLSIGEGIFFLSFFLLFIYFIALGIFKGLDGKWTIEELASFTLRFLSILLGLFLLPLAMIVYVVRKFINTLNCEKNEIENSNSLNGSEKEMEILPPNDIEKTLNDIEFECFFCEENLIVDKVASGKMAPCPSCGRINKIP
jgi:hypothetical protein